jgi:leader peptidase (prepilin peptidase) / N-methyltransferase
MMASEMSVGFALVIAVCGAGFFQLGLMWCRRAGPAAMLGAQPDTWAWTLFLAVCTFAASLSMVTPIDALWLLFVGCTVILMVCDARAFWLPLPVMLLLAMGGLVHAAWDPARSVVDAALASGLTGLVVAALARGYARLRHRAGLGGGDPIFLAAVATWLPWQHIPTFVLISCLAALIAVVVQLLRGKSLSTTTMIPFGLFIGVGALVCAGQQRLTL